MTLAPLVLVVDDEPAIRRLLRTSLLAQSYRVMEAASGQAALEAVAAGGIDTVVLDLGLPDLDGMEAIRRLRALSAVPLVVLTAREDERSKVAALDLGADDYVTKPFGMAELMARLRTAQRHRLQQQGAPPVFRSGGLAVDLVRRIVTRDGQPVHLSPREYDILALLVKHAGRVLTHRQILGALWGAGGDVQQLRVYVRQLRQKIEAEPERPRHILTETGVGYRLAVEE
ncbi:MAG: response regulator [Rhodospirillales bacterium]|nr:response regulator [Rhodospirillales bacterium]